MLFVICSPENYVTLADHIELKFEFLFLSR